MKSSRNRMDFNIQKYQDISLQQINGFSLSLSKRNTIDLKVG